MAIGAHDLAGLGGGGGDAIDLAIDVGGHWIDIGAVGERDREVGGPKEQRIDAGRRRDRLDIVERGARLDHGEGNGERVGLAQVDFLIRNAGQRGGAVRTPAALADRRKLRVRHIGARILGRVDHRCDDALGAEIERAAHAREFADRDAHDRRRAGLADGGDRRQDRGGVPQPVLAVQGDGGKAFSADQLGDDRVGQAAPAADHGLARAQSARQRERRLRRHLGRCFRHGGASQSARWSGDLER